MMRFVVWLASINSVIATACDGGGEVPFATIKLKRLTRLGLSHYSSTQKVEEEEESRHSLETWQVWAVFVVGVVVLFLVAYIMRLKLLASKSSKHDLQEIDHDHDHDQEQSPVMKDVVVKAEEERRSELELLVEQEEWFTVEELMEGVAELRSHGLYSGLYVVRLIKNDAVYAVKRLRKLKGSMEEFGVAMRRAGGLRHPNILALVGYNNSLQEKLLIYRFQTHGSLLNLFQSYAQGERAFPWKLRVSIAVGIARGLDFIYRSDDRSITPHGMIKLSNIMLSDEYEPLISEYGYAEFLDPTGPCRLSMKGYAAPDKTLTEKSDVYSFGVILLQLLTGKFVEKSGLDDLPRWVRSSLLTEEWTGEVFDDEISDVGMYAFPLLNVALKCVAVDADERPTIAQVFQKIQEVVTAQQD